MKYSLFLVAFAVLLGCFALQTYSEPILTGYDFELDLSDKMANVTPSTSDIPVTVFFKIYWRVDDTDIHMAIVCNGSSITGTNVNTYCGFGFRKSNATTGMLGSDSIAGTVTSANVVQLADLTLEGRGWGDPVTCAGSSTSIICPDADRASPCRDDAVLVGGRREDEFLVLEFSRKLSTGDTRCDVPIVPGVGIPVIFSIGLIDLTSVDPWPYSMLPHDFAANVLLENFYTNFIRKPAATGTETGTQTQPDTSTSNESTDTATATDTNLPPGTDRESSSASSLSLIYSLIAFSTLIAVRWL